MKCQVTSQNTRKVMISRDVKVASYKEICGGEKKRVNIGYRNERDWFKISDNSLLRDPPQSGLEVRGSRPHISHEWEVLPVFFQVHNIEPNWVQAELHWNPEEGTLLGKVGKAH